MLIYAYSNLPQTLILILIKKASEASGLSLLPPLSLNVTVNVSHRDLYTHMHTPVPSNPSSCYWLGRTKAAEEAAGVLPRGPKVFGLSEFRRDYATATAVTSSTGDASLC